MSTPSWITPELVASAQALGPEAGRPNIMRRLGLTDHKARVLMDHLGDLEARKLGAIFVPGQRGVCEVCGRGMLVMEPGQTAHRVCLTRPERRPPDFYEDHRKGGPVPGVEQVAQPESPFKTAVFDLETYQLSAGWGVLLVGCILVHGGSEGPKWYDFALPDFPSWPEHRSDDRDLAVAIYSVLSECQVWIGHNSAAFDVPWLNTLAAKYGLPPVERKLTDPVLIARRKLRVGANSLDALADYFKLDEQKMHLSPDVWKAALLDNDQEAWSTLRERCRSDVSILNKLAARLSPFVGVIDYAGSFRR